MIQAFDFSRLNSETQRISPGLAHDICSELNRFVDKESFLQSNGRDGASAPSGAGRWYPNDLLTLSEPILQALTREAADKRASDEWVLSSSGIRYYYDPTLARAHYRSGVIESIFESEYGAVIEYILGLNEALQDVGFYTSYLGPLREEPKVVHGAWDEIDSSLPVGIKGELTAEVLSRLRSSSVTHRTWDGEERTETVHEAVARWCEYLGIGERVDVVDRGKQGRSVELYVNGVGRDLTTIGVGASQLLPVLVAALTAQPDALLLIEQPELHLHPSVQARLADFFLFARRDIRYIVETHSEYILTRLRRRIAEERASAADVEVLFVTQKEGLTNVESLGLSELGDLEYWPEGFFDVQDLDAIAIAGAITKRVTVQRDR